jgi:hypothetical protein
VTVEARGALASRLIAIAIAVLGLADPVVTMPGRTNATVAVVSDASGGRTDPVPALAERVTAALSPMFTVVRGPFSTADAVVVVGSDVPGDWSGAGPAFVVAPDQTMARVDIEAIDAPRRAPVDGRVTVTARLHAVGMAGRADRILLRSGGVALDRITHTWSTADERADVVLGFLPSGTGLVPLRVSVEPGSDGPAVASADVAVAIDAHRWAVLVYDARPSWASTFVRRAIEDDRRFTVVTRTVTSRGLSIETGQAVPGLGDAAKLAAFDAILVGAPDALTAGDVAGLETFARERGGTVVLMLDRAETGAAARLIGVDRFTTRQGASSVSITATHASVGKWLASELALPDALPPGADLLALANVGPATRPIVWQSPEGGGHIVVSGALDAWRYRADPQTAFAPFWQTVMADAAAEAPPVVDVQVSESVVGFGDAVDVEVTRRDTGARAIGGAMSMRSWIERADGTRVESVRLWPDAVAGRFRARVQLPATAGAYRIVAADAVLPAPGGDGTLQVRGAAGVFVVAAVARAAPDRSAIAGAWAHARGGMLVPAARAGEIPVLVRAALHQEPQRVRAHPMRSPWWMVPFALALGAEWWSRRRRGLA